MSKKQPPQKNTPAKAAQPAAAPPFWKRHWNEIRVSAVLSILILLVFGQVTSFQFVDFDDNGFITENAVVQAGLTRPGFSYAFVSFDEGSWHPLTWLSHMAMCEYAGLNPGPHHAANVFLHLVNTVLLLFLMRSLTGAFWRSALVAAVFAVHPLHVEDVAWVAERKELLATLFWFLTPLAWLQWVRGRGRKWYALALVLFALGLMSKPTIVTLPFALLLLDYWPLDRLRSRADLLPRFLEKVPLILMSAAASAATYFGQQSAGAFSDLGAVPWSTRAMSIPGNYFFYLTRTFWPAGLAPHYQFFGQVSIVEFAIGLAAIAAITVVVIWKGRQRRYPIAGWFWFVGVLVPMSGVVYFGGSIHADRFAYVPHVGLCILIFWGLHEWLGEARANSKKARIAAAVLIAAMAVRSWHQTGYWRDSYTLFRHTDEVTENNAVAKHIVAKVLIDANRDAAALPLVEAAVRIDPKYGSAWTSLSNIYYRKRDYDKSLETIDAAIRAQPRNPTAHYNRGLVLARLGKEPESIQALQTALGMNLRMKLQPSANFEIGRSFMRQHKEDQAIPFFERALEIDPYYVLARKNLAFALMGMHRFVEAYGHFKLIAPLQPNDTDVQRALAYLNTVVQTGGR